MGRVSFALFLGATTSSASARAQQQQQPYKHPLACVESPFKEYKFCDRSLPLDERVDDLVSRIMALSPPDRSDSVIPNILSARGSPRGNITSLQTQLGVPGVDWGLNCVHGVQSTCINGKCPTSFPSPTSLGASWDFDTHVVTMGDIMAKELRALWQENAQEHGSYGGGAHAGLSCWSPNINLARDPRWGRNQEVPSEDPNINANYGAAYTVGLQGEPVENDNNFPLKAVSTIKHFLVYNFERLGKTDRFNFDAIVDKYDLYDTYLPIFRKPIAESKAGGVMCSYNAVNGIPSCANPLMKSLLRDDWNFTGYISSDSGAVYDFLPANHNFSATGEEAVCAALNASMNMQSTDNPKHPMFDKYVSKALREGLCSADLVEASLKALIKLEFRLGLYDPPASSTSSSTYPYWNWASMSDVATAESAATNLKMADASMTLLKNSGGNTLPIQPKKKKIALVGPGANSTDLLFPNYMGYVCPDETYNCIDPIYQTATKMFDDNEDVEFMFQQGCDVGGAVDQGKITEAVDAVDKFDPDYVILVLGLGQGVEAEFHDRYDLRLTPPQRALVAALAAKSPSWKTVMVLLNGGVVAIEDQLPVVDAVLEAWYPGPTGAVSILRTLFGLNNPGGRLPVTMYKNEYINEVNMTDVSMTKGVGRTYRYYTGSSVNFPFGYGLSYGLPLDVSSASASSSGPAGGSLTVTFTTKSASGDDVAQNYPKSTVAQLYVVPEVSTLKTNPATGENPPTKSRLPLKALVGSKRVTLDTSASSVTSSIVLNTEVGSPDNMLCLVSDSGKRQVFPGTYTLYGTTEHSDAIISGDGSATPFLKHTITVAHGYVCPF